MEVYRGQNCDSCWRFSDGEGGEVKTFEKGLNGSVEEANALGLADDEIEYLEQPIKAVRYI